ncbi:NitT/TauT family transport system ATP-binding protein [Palleronia aestuarii]|uniref:NitT/TauT family transport system ATP-binding protein n=1 Tax=Palleronia aestuarii TaxID=568105 RepID=A0A2W7NCS2_9RHOB|nr:ABC transporter substrate-binding protein [Palleronia aestuarii]PZX15947.1 NitT/TauT family transport system ATP-binding protein [Palleronia aestuarii]
MKASGIDIGFMPLLDAAPLLVAQEMGFAAEEGLALNLHRAPSWSSARDALTFGQVTAAHMLAPVPVAMALGLGGGAAPLDALSVLSMNGTVVGVSRDLARRMRDAGHAFDFANARAAGQALIAAAPEPLRIGVPFPFSMHAELVFYWLSALGRPSPQSLSVRTVPPPLMADAVRAGEIDAFCVGEPWGSKAVESGMGELLLPGSAIWAYAPEKILAVRRDWAEANPDLSSRLIRAVWRAGRWLDTADGRSLAAELLSRPTHLDISPELVERGLSGRLILARTGETQTAPRFVAFHAGQANFPWRSQAAWIGGQLAARTGLDRDEAAASARAVFRSDLYRAALENTGAELPAASSRIEGALACDSPVAATRGDTVLFRDSFFDGRTFDPVF